MHRKSRQARQFRWRQAGLGISYAGGQDMNEAQILAFEALLEARANEVGAALDAELGEAALPGETARPARLMAAMRHGALNGGKRLRPFLLIESAGLFGVPAGSAMPAALALECVHCYSLIHDDLPAMDNDDTRRGKPTVHIAYDDATAILAGDSLLTLAFDLLARPNSGTNPAAQLALVEGLARAAGIGGMAGGQMLDIEAENGNPGEAGIRLLQSMKTGALIRYACEAGAILGEAGSGEIARMRAFGEKIGAVFQLADDILDETASTEAMGKKTGKDAQAGKATLVGLYGLERAREVAAGLVGKAEALLEPHGEAARTLRDCARYVLARQR